MGIEIVNDEEQVVERKRWGLFGLPFTFTKYIVKQDILTIESGCFTKKEDDCYMYKIQDVELTRNFMQRLFGLGCVICY
ncbi:MAG: PH domain-containing protein, partial [Lachnospiraceae bacterium]|nr:PH domain-containing protein [Lachnospiraceae bacterium]